MRKPLITLVRIASAALVLAALSSTPAHALFDPPGDVPEIDPGVARGMVAVILAGVAILTDRLRQR